MPTYEYECRACGEVHEVFHGMNEKGPRKCPSCGKLKLRKLMSAGAGLIFKGDGFYTTDYRSKDYKEKAKKDSGDSGGESKSKPEGKSSGPDPKACGSDGACRTCPARPKD